MSDYVCKSVVRRKAHVRIYIESRAYHKKKQGYGEQDYFCMEKRRVSADFCKLRENLPPDPAEKVGYVAYENHVGNRPDSYEVPVEYSHYDEEDYVQKKLPCAELPSYAPGNDAVLESVGIRTQADFNQKRQEKSHEKDTRNHDEEFLPELRHDEFFKLVFQHKSPSIVHEYI